MIQGTSSSVGKSVLTAALCRVFQRRDLRVAPFKAQNMSNNAAVCEDGSEIGRSQWLQAIAAKTAPRVEMNPVLLKPEADSRSQVIVQGRVWKTLKARQYYEYRDQLWNKVTESLEFLRRELDLVLIEGAGSPAELNLAESDMVNMRVAQHCNSPVLLVGDIDRGGVFAQLLGTLWLLPEESRQLICGLVVNKFRGDVSLFDDGVSILEQRGGVPVLGVLPYLRDLNLPEEDAATLKNSDSPIDRPETIHDIAVIQLPHIANFDDFDPLRSEAGVSLRFVASLRSLGNPSAIILPGTKSTMRDLQWLRETGLAAKIKEHAEQGTAIVGICGGYQILGKVIDDPNRVESELGTIDGLGLLPIHSIFRSAKTTRQLRGVVLDAGHWLPAKTEIEGYEIHMGQSKGGNAWLAHRDEFADRESTSSISADGRVWGCYVHGLFANEMFRRAWLGSLGWTPAESQTLSYTLNESLDRLADHVERNIDIKRLDDLIQR
jgi:adenosylcobyric acid synthase